MHPYKNKKVDIDYSDPRKKRTNFSLSNKSLKLLSDNIEKNQRSAFIDFLITHYCEYEAGNFNRLFFSKKTAEIISRNNEAKGKNLKITNLELINELNKKLEPIKFKIERESEYIQTLKRYLEALKNG